MPARTFRHALVAGGSMAGLLAARVLSDHFERVTLVERDRLVHSPEPRKGVPQGRHAHVLLPRGERILDGLFPGFAAELSAAGAVRVRTGRELAWNHAGTWRAGRETDLSFLAMSRPLLETIVARRVGALPNVAIQDGTRVEAPRFDREHGVTGLRVRHADPGAQPYDIEGDLVVDATGRGSATPHWLEECGFDPPPAERIAAPVTYATCTFGRTDPLTDWRILMITGAPEKRTGVVLPIESNRWLASLCAFFDERPPHSHEEFLAFARSLRAPDLYEAFKNSAPLSEVVHFRFAGSLRRRYEKLRRFPQGLIVQGDAVCSFNPIYAQGMTVSAIEAETLGSALARTRLTGGLDPAFAQRWFRMIEPVVDAAWDGVLVEDFLFRELAGRSPRRIKALQWYMERVHRATHKDPAVTDQFLRVISFVAPPRSLFSPRILTKVLP